MRRGIPELSTDLRLPLHLPFALPQSNGDSFSIPYSVLPTPYYLFFVSVVHRLRRPRWMKRAFAICLCCVELTMLFLCSQFCIWAWLQPSRNPPTHLSRNKVRGEAAIKPVAGRRAFASNQGQGLSADINVAGDKS
jgi:hypothetical protein